MDTASWRALDVEPKLVKEEYDRYETRVSVKMSKGRVCKEAGVVVGGDEEDIVMSGSNVDPAESEWVSNRINELWYI